MGGKGGGESIPFMPPPPRRPCPCRLLVLPRPHPALAPGLQEFGECVRVGGGVGGQRACRLLPGRSRCLRAGPVALRWAEVGCRGWGAAS